MSEMEERILHRAPLSMETKMIVVCDNLVSVQAGEISLVSHPKCITKHARFL